MRYISCLITVCALCGCGKTVNDSSCQLKLTIEENNSSSTSNLAVVIGDSMVSQAVHLTNRLIIKRLKLRLDLATGAPFQVWIGYGIPNDVFDTSYTKFDYTAPSSIDSPNHPKDIWLDLPTPITADPAYGDLYIEVVSRSIAILSTDFGPLGPSPFRTAFQKQNSIHAWGTRDAGNGMSIGIDGTSDNCDGTQTGQ